MKTLLLLLGTFCLAQGAQVCYDDYGCFTNEPPFNQIAVRLPQKPDVIKTKFFLFTGRNAATRDEIQPLITASSLNSTTHFDKTRKTVVIAHGYTGHSDEYWVEPMVKSILGKEDYNVFVVDWRTGATLPYVQATGNARLVGVQVAKLLESMVELGMSEDDVHMIGVGMGAHMLSYAGNTFALKGKPIGRITGLNPASLLFEFRDVRVHLDDTDAKFVDVIHTDINSAYLKGIGTSQKMGHVDMFPNGGTAQPGCSRLWPKCSHMRATDLFIESINSTCPFRQYHCKSYQDFKDNLCSSGCSESAQGRMCPSLGWNAVKYAGRATPKDGAFYSTTSDNIKHFCSYHYSVTFHTGQGIWADMDGVVTIKLSGSNGEDTIKLPEATYGSDTKVTVMITTQKNLGDLEELTVNTDTLIDRWWLYAVVIRPVWNGKPYTGCYRKWINLHDETTPLKTDLPSDAYCPE